MTCMNGRTCDCIEIGMWDQKGSSGEKSRRSQTWGCVSAALEISRWYGTAYQRARPCRPGRRSSGRHAKDTCGKSHEPGRLGVGRFLVTGDDAWILRDAVPRYGQPGQEELRRITQGEQGDATAIFLRGTYITRSRADLGPVNCLRERELTSI
jgi:hypothetical protein